LNAKLAKVVTLSLSEMEPVPVPSLNAVLVKFAKTENVLRSLLLQYAGPTKCLLLQDAGTHALIQNSKDAQMYSQPFSILNSAPTPKTVNT
jgi:hypothetical protein